jgi:phosphatidylinositol kinase/protein kinase (PI-3  family)
VTVAEEEVDLVDVLVSDCLELINPILVAQAASLSKYLVMLAAHPKEHLRFHLGTAITAMDNRENRERDLRRALEQLKLSVAIVEKNRSIMMVDRYPQMYQPLEKAILQLEQHAEVSDASLQRVMDSLLKFYQDLDQLVQREKQISLKDALHELSEMRNLKVCVPSLRYSDSTPTIDYLSDQVKILDSKQRPRQVKFIGSGGREHTYLLKSHEDLRLDERVMQLFALVNMLREESLQHVAADAGNQLRITRFAVVPLATTNPAAGLLEWVEETETLQNLLLRERGSNANVERTEQKKSLCNAADERQLERALYVLPKLGKVELFRRIISRTTCDEMSRGIWHRAASSEDWLIRRSQFTVSLSNMSMVGYVLGLGDRHLNNILIHNQSANIVHIDFGDSFDVNRRRSSYPEKVPFRLTRMLVAVMELGSVQGLFTHTARQTMALLRANQDSVVALLQAFILDPIVSARLEKEPDMGLQPKVLIAEMRNKLQGKAEFAFNTTDSLTARSLEDEHNAQSVQEQVSSLILEATSEENLAEMYPGWCPYW